MNIDIDVAASAKHFGLDPHLIQAVVNAEGNIVKAVSISVPSILTLPLELQRSKALEITCRSAVHAMSDYIKTNARTEFVEFWANRWAPVGTANDPHHLNENWPGNVLLGWQAA